MPLHIPSLPVALEHLRSVTVGQLKAYFGRAEKGKIGGVSFSEDDISCRYFVEKQRLTFDEYIILLLVLIPHVQPNFFNKIIGEYLPQGGDFPEFGGVKSAAHRDLLPTGETAQFILAGDNLEKRLDVQRILSSEHWFWQKQILWVEQVREGEPAMSGRLILNLQIVEEIIFGRVSRPRFSAEFPAMYIETKLDWDDVVLNPQTSRQICEIENWIKQNDTLLYTWGMERHIKPGYRALFHGTPGTGKTLTATLLGKHTGKDVFRIDLSRVVSKYIGETEKNLSRLFDRAEHQNWILFFDEADALFGKRTEIRDAHDKYANQEVAYLLQRIENYNGLVILASNQRANIDEAFVRRLQNIVHFPKPGPEERYAIWRKTFPPQIKIADDINWHQVAARFELTGAGILNVIHYIAVEVLADQSQYLDFKRLESAILREYIKEGKLV